jgi:hypothetical protein
MEMVVLQTQDLGMVQQEEDFLLLELFHLAPQEEMLGLDFYKMPSVVLPQVAVQVVLEAEAQEVLMVKQAVVVVVDILEDLEDQMDPTVRGQVRTQTELTKLILRQLTQARVL